MNSFDIKLQKVAENQQPFAPNTPDSFIVEVGKPNTAFWHQFQVQAIYLGVMAKTKTTRILYFKRCYPKAGVPKYFGIPERQIKQSK